MTTSSSISVNAVELESGEHRFAVAESSAELGKAPSMASNTLASQRQGQITTLSCLIKISMAID